MTVFNKKINSSPEIKTIGCTLNMCERRVRVTMACGSGACATSVAASLLNLSSRKNKIILDGGNLFVNWLEDKSVTLSGVTEKVFEGVIGN